MFFHEHPMFVILVSRRLSFCDISDKCLETTLGNIISKTIAKIFEEKSIFRVFAKLQV